MDSGRRTPAAMTSAVGVPLPQRQLPAASLTPSECALAQSVRRWSVDKALLRAMMTWQSTANPWVLLTDASMLARSKNRRQGDRSGPRSRSRIAKNKNVRSTRISGCRICTIWAIPHPEKFKI